MVVLGFITCGSLKKVAKNSSEIKRHYAAYDDSMLSRNTLPIMMPYNRILDPAGKVISYGNPNVENHSLDIVEMPGTNLFAVEDRYGIAVFDGNKNKIIDTWSFINNGAYNGLMSTFSGIQSAIIDGKTHILWGAAKSYSNQSKVLDAVWDNNRISVVDTFNFVPEGVSPLALPNEILLQNEAGKIYLYVVLNGNNQLKKIDYAIKKEIWSADTGVAPYGIVINKNFAYVTNWGGNAPTENTLEETAGVPYGKAYVDSETGAINNGSVSVFDTESGKLNKIIPVGLHPNDIIKSNNGNWIFVSNGNSDDISVINADNQTVEETISVKINPGENGFIGDSPNAMMISPNDSCLYVANGLDNAIAVVKLNIPSKSSSVDGFIPTEAYPGGLAIKDNKLFVTNLEGEGARVNSKEMSMADPITLKVLSGAYNAHNQKATISTIPILNAEELAKYTEKVKELMLHFRLDVARLAPRKNQPPRPTPERIGEPSIFKHVIYIIKENKTYDQVLGDLPQGNGNKDLCVFGDDVTPNQHQLAKDYVLLDNYYASGKCSAEGHQWTDAGMVSDYVEKNVRAWFRSYPHVQEDAMVYDKKGFIWDNAANHGKSVRIYGEACVPILNDSDTWTSIYTDFLAGKKLKFTNSTTIEPVKKFLSPNYPGYDSHRIPDILRAKTFIDELHDYENQSGDNLPELIVVALPNDHTAGTSSYFPTPASMVADNDLALGQIIEAITKSRFWENTVIFITEDDSQTGWDHVSAYRTTCFVISPYSKLQKTVSVNYNQTSMVRSIEQILGIPPMNLMDATARPMFECFDNVIDTTSYAYLQNRIPLDDMNAPLAELSGKALYYAQQSMRPEYERVDAGNDEMLNRIIWFSVKGNKKYPSWLTLPNEDDDD